MKTEDLKMDKEKTCSEDRAEDSILHEAVCKMLDTLGLHIEKRVLGYPAENVSETKRSIVREFRRRDGALLEWRNTNPKTTRKMGNGIPYGSWTVFKDDDRATFKLLVEDIEEFKLVCKKKTIISNEVLTAKCRNPFYGCKSCEEAIVMSDVLACSGVR